MVAKSRQKSIMVVPAAAATAAAPSSTVGGTGNSMSIVDAKQWLTYRQVMRPMTNNLAYKLLTSGRLAFWMRWALLVVQMTLTAFVWKGFWCSRAAEKNTAVNLFIVTAAIVVQNQVTEFSFLWNKEKHYASILQTDDACSRHIDQKVLRGLLRWSIRIKRIFYANCVWLGVATVGNLVYPERFLYPLFGINKSAERIECCYTSLESLLAEVPCLDLRFFVQLVSVWNVYYWPVYLLQTIVFVFNIVIMRRAFRSLTVNIRAKLYCRGVASSTSNVDEAVAQFLEDHKTLSKMYRDSQRCNQLTFTSFCASLLIVFVFIVRSLDLLSSDVDSRIRRNSVFTVQLVSALIFAFGFIVCVIMLASINEEVKTSILSLLRSDHVSVLGNSNNKTSESVDKTILAHLENMSLDSPLMKFFDKWVVNRELILTAGVMVTSFVFMVYGL